MQVTAKSASARTTRSDLLVLVVHSKEVVKFPAGYEKAGKAAKAAGDLPSDFRTSCTLYPDSKASSKRLMILSIGDAPESEKLRRCAALAIQAAERVEAADVCFEISSKVASSLPKYCGDARIGIALGEGFVLGAYTYAKPSSKKASAHPTKRVTVCHASGKVSAALSKGVKSGMLRGQATCFARDLANKAGNLLTPTKLAAEARKIATGSKAKGAKISFKAMTEPQMKKLGMGSLLSVSAGSSEPARLIVLDHKPNGSARGQKTMLVVGKGLTFDAGGYSLKPSAGMDEMRYDMCGGAAVLGLFHGLASGAIESKHRILGVVPSSENLINGHATKPGDVVTACNGTTIEILNTDAEGRLILADALAWSIKTYKPDACVNLATLTGAVITALGHEMSGAMGNNQALIDEVIAAGTRADDPCWQLPLWEVHREQMKSKFADLRNINSRADGNGSTCGGAFLSHFVGDTPWCHLDIAGSAWNAKPKDHYRGGGSGAGVRVLLEWIASRS